MKRNREAASAGAPWHIDCRIEAELPEDNLVGTRFLITAAFSAAAVAAMLFAGWLGYLSLNLRHQIADWEQRIKDNRAEVLDLKRMQGEYAAMATKIDQAHALLRPEYYVSGLIADLGRTRPLPVAIDVIDWNDTGIVVRGNLRETSARATEIMQNYVEALSRDDKIGPLFQRIVLTDLARGSSGDTLRFEISFRPKAGRP